MVEAVGGSFMLDRSAPSGAVNAQPHRGFAWRRPTAGHFMAAPQRSSRVEGDQARAGRAAGAAREHQVSAQHIRAAAPFARDQLPAWR